MSKPTTSQALFYLLLTIVGLYVLSSLLSFSFSMSDWNAFSNIIFWGASIILATWTINDYIISRGKQITTNSKIYDNYREKQKLSEDKFESKELKDFRKNIHPNVIPKPALKKVHVNKDKEEISTILKRMSETTERIKYNLAEKKRLDQELSESDYKFERVNSLNEVRIGNQLWMTRNLNVNKFRNGDKIREAKTSKEWIYCLKQNIPAFCYYENNNKYAYGYGMLYNYYAIIDKRCLAPEGWSIPSANDWLELKNYVEDNTHGCGVGEALKSVNQVNSILGREEALDIHPRWDESMDNIGMDLFDFQAFPGGFRGADDGATFSDLGKDGCWWTTTHDDEGFNTIILGVLSILTPHFHLEGYSESVGASVRLVKYASINQKENEEFEAEYDLPF